MPDPQPTFASMAEFFRTMFDATVDVFTVQENGKDVGGMLVIDGEITNLAVDADLRKRGIAWVLINMAKVRYDKLTLVCTPKLVPFYYEQHRFTISSECQGGYRMDWSRCE